MTLGQDQWPRVMPNISNAIDNNLQKNFFLQIIYHSKISYGSLVVIIFNTMGEPVATTLATRYGKYVR